MVLLVNISVVSSYVVLFEISPDSPAFVIGQCVSVLLEKCVDAGDSSVPGILQILQCQTPEAEVTMLFALSSYSSHLLK